MKYYLFGIEEDFIVVACEILSSAFSEIFNVSRSRRYSNTYTMVLDKVAYTCLYPWAASVSLFCACYISNLLEKIHPQKKLVQYFLYGPVFAVLIIFLLPLGVLGALLWIGLCVFAEKQNYTYCAVEKPEEMRNMHMHLENPKFIEEMVFTFASSNVLLGPDFLNKYNHNTSAYLRSGKIGDCISRQSKKHLKNLASYPNHKLKADYVLAEFPSVDFFCFQEVWERFHASVLMKSISNEYGYFIYDVGDFNFKGNLYLLGSGLMFASKKPILEAEFKPFSCKTKHAKFTSLGILCVKVLLNYSKNGVRTVGYIANLHTQAFQGNDPVIHSQLSETLEFVEKFKKRNSQAGDVVKFDVICGDFNADNMSPGDEDVQNHPLFDEYIDICVEKPGRDKEWAIGTELRQMTLFNPNIASPETFKEALIDDSSRRLYVLDADVVIHRASLMTTVVRPDNFGKVKPVSYGGMRRVDKILMHESTKAKTLGYGFISALTHLTDHLPVCMTIQTLP